jgi:GTP-binding protein HflX
METVKKSLRVLPVHIMNPRDDEQKALLIGQEFESLIETLGGHIVERVMQKIAFPDKHSYIGRGKIQEIAEIVKDKDIDVVIINGAAKPGQIHNVKTELQKVNVKIDVWDRVDLILHIFDKHANTTEAKLQIELARMRYMGPRIFGMGYIMSNQGGGIGTRGIGETNTELMKRHWRDQMKNVTDQLEKITKTHEQQLEKRRRAGFKTVSIVGYTNAGKSSLFNLLAKKHVLAENALFATLDSTVGKLYLPELQEEILITDTIGFIRSLPPKLIDAFKSTLTESLHADLLLHVIDASDPEVEEKIKVVEGILWELGRNTEQVVYVFNKADILSQTDRETIADRYKDLHPVFVSVKENQGMDSLISAITSRLKSS